MTQAERSRLEAKEKKRAEEDCFEFLRDLRDVSFPVIAFGSFFDAGPPELMVQSESDAACPLPCRCYATHHHIERQESPG
jgi:hypothetical protein